MRQLCYFQIADIGFIVQCTHYPGYNDKLEFMCDDQNGLIIMKI